MSYYCLTPTQLLTTWNPKCPRPFPNAVYVDGSTCCPFVSKAPFLSSPFPRHPSWSLFPVNDGTAVLGFDKLPWWGVLLISIGLAVVTAIIVWFAVCPRLKKKIECKYLSLVFSLCVNSNHVNHKIDVIISNSTMSHIQLHSVISRAQLGIITIAK